MESFTSLTEQYPAFLPAVILLFFWEATWKLIALWKAGRNNNLAWFIVIALVNSIGILPIIYLFMQKRNRAL